MPEWLKMINKICHKIIALPFNADQKSPFITEQPILNDKYAYPHIQFTKNDVNTDAIVNFAHLNSSKLEGIVMHCKTGDVCSAAFVKLITAVYAQNSNKKFKEYNKHAYKLLKRAKERQINVTHPFAI